MIVEIRCLVIIVIALESTNVKCILYVSNIANFENVLFNAILISKLFIHLDVNRFVFSIHHFECVGSISIHVPISVRSTYFKILFSKIDSL